MKQRFIMSLKAAVALSAFCGVALGQLSARADGYSDPWRRLLYFTAQSNLFLGIVALLFLVALWQGRIGLLKKLYLLRYIFTVSICLTGLVFCLVLAPFAGQGYTPWTATNVLTHVLTPVLALLDFSLDRRAVGGKKSIVLSLVPPLGYFTLASALELFGFDFGRGVTYPYFFMNYCSPVGLFGIGGERPFVVGACYWILLLILTVFAVARLLARFSTQK